MSSLARLMSCVSSVYYSPAGDVMLLGTLPFTDLQSYLPQLTSRGLSCGSQFEPSAYIQL